MYQYDLITGVQPCTWIVMYKYNLTIGTQSIKHFDNTQCVLVTRQGDPIFTNFTEQIYCLLLLTQMPPNQIYRTVLDTILYPRPCLSSCPVVVLAGWFRNRILLEEHKGH